MSSGRSGRERSRKDFLNTDFEHTFGRLVDRGWGTFPGSPKFPSTFVNHGLQSKDSRTHPAYGFTGVSMELGPNWHRVGPKFGASWAQMGPKLGSNWPKFGPNWPEWPQVALGLLAKDQNHLVCFGHPLAMQALCGHAGAYSPNLPLIIPKQGVSNFVCM